MTIIIREEKILDGKKYNDVEVYKSDKFPITAEDEGKAKALDHFLSSFFSNLYKELSDKNMLSLRGSKGVIDLWYYVGQKLQFIDDPQKVEPSDKKYIWKALWYHAKNITPGEAKSRAGTQRDHFLYCYKLAKFEKDFVKNAGNWRDWMDFFDSPILSNEIFLNWFKNNAQLIKEKKIKNWLREFIKLIRNEFQNIDMSFLGEIEINSRCDKLLNSFIGTKNAK